MNGSAEEARGYLSALASAGALALTGICIRYLCASCGMEPLALAFWRNFFMVAVLFVVLELGYPFLIEVSRCDLARFLGYGVVLALFNYLWTLSVALNGAAVATFLVYSSVPFTSLFGWIFLGERLRLPMILSVVISLVGCLLISGAFDQAAGPISPVGVISGLASGVCFAVYSLVVRSSRRRGMNSWTIILYAFGFSAVILMIGQYLVLLISPGAAGLIDSLFSLRHAAAGWIILIFLAVGPTLIGFGLYNVSLGYLPSAVVNLLATLEPPFTAVFAYFLLGEVLSGNQLFGALLIFGAVILLKAGRPGAVPAADLRIKQPQQVS